MKLAQVRRHCRPAGFVGSVSPSGLTGPGSPSGFFGTTFFLQRVRLASGDELQRRAHECGVEVKPVILALELPPEDCAFACSTHGEVAFV
jgi:hypothetical protein